MPSGDAAGAAEAGNGAAAARVLSAGGRAATADAHLPTVLSSGIAALGSHGSVAIAPVASGLGSQRLMSVRLTANSGLVYNSTPIPTLLPPGGGCMKLRGIAIELCTCCQWLGDARMQLQGWPQGGRPSQWLANSSPFIITLAFS